MCDSSPLFFNVVFQQSHPITAVNKTVLLKKHLFRKHLTSAFIFIFGNYFVSTQKQQAGPTPSTPNAHQAAWLQGQASLSVRSTQQQVAQHCGALRTLLGQHLQLLL